MFLTKYRQSIVNDFEHVTPSDGGELWRFDFFKFEAKSFSTRV